MLLNPRWICPILGERPIQLFMKKWEHGSSALSAHRENPHPINTHSYITSCVPKVVVMSKYIRLDIESFNKELESYRITVVKNKASLSSKPWLEKQIFFWMESTRFLISELEIWNELGDHVRCAETTVRIQKALERVSMMMQQLG